MPWRGRALDRGRVDADDVLAGLPRRGEDGALSLGLGALVGREVPAACGVSSRPTVPGASPSVAADEVWTRRGSRPGGGADRCHRAVDVDAPHRLGVVDAQRVDAGDVEGELGALHAACQRGLVEHVPARHLGAAALQRGGGRVGARERDHVVSARHEALDERAADHPAAAGDEDATHEVVRSEAENFMR